MNGMTEGMRSVIASATSLHITEGLPDPNEVESYTCCECGKTIQRIVFEIANIQRKTFVFPACPCRIAELEKQEQQRERMERRMHMERIYSKSLMNEDLVQARLSNFVERKGTELAFREAKAFALGFETRRTGLLLFGQPGNGKSHLSAAIHHHLDAEGYVCLFLEVQRLLKLAEDAKRFSSKVTVNDVINAAIQCDLLTLDELGVGTLDKDQYDVLSTIINGRQGKVTNYSTNLDLDELSNWFRTDTYGKPLDNKGRMVDRLIGSCEIVHNHGTSKRQEDAMKRINGDEAI